MSFTHCTIGNSISVSARKHLSRILKTSAGCGISQIHFSFLVKLLGQFEVVACTTKDGKRKRVEIYSSTLEAFQVRTAAQKPNFLVSLGNCFNEETLSMNKKELPRRERKLCSFNRLAGTFVRGVLKCAFAAKSDVRHTTRQNFVDSIYDCESLFHFSCLWCLFWRCDVFGIPLVSEHKSRSAWRIIHELLPSSLAGIARETLNTEHKTNWLQIQLNGTINSQWLLLVYDPTGEEFRGWTNLHSKSSTPKLEPANGREVENKQSKFMRISLSGS